jgi:hypothetical protein
METNSGGRSTRVVFKHNVVCDVYNVNSTSHQKCRDNITSYTEEEFVPTNVPENHFTFQIKRNEAIARPIPSRLVPQPIDHIPPVEVAHTTAQFNSYLLHGETDDILMRYYSAGDRTLIDYNAAQENPKNYRSLQEEQRGQYQDLELTLEDDNPFAASDRALNTVELDEFGRRRGTLSRDQIFDIFSDEALIEGDFTRPASDRILNQFELEYYQNIRDGRGRLIIQDPVMDIGVELADLAGTSSGAGTSAAHAANPPPAPSVPTAPTQASSTALVPANNAPSRTNAAMDLLNEYGARALDEFRLFATRKNAMDFGAMALSSGVGLVAGYYTGKALTENDWFRGLLMSDTTTWEGAAKAYSGGALIGLTAGAATGAAASLTQTLGTATQRGVLWAMTSKGIATTAEQITARAFLQAAGSSFLKGIAEGAFVGALLVPLDMYLQNLFLRNGMNHAGAGATSGVITGVVGAGISAGLMYAGIVSAPATFGMSIALAVGAIAVSTIAGAIFGAQQDKEAREYTNNYNFHRNILVENLPKYNYDVDKTIAAVQAENPDAFWGEWYKDGAQEFIYMLRETFNDRPYVHRDAASVSADDLKTNGYMQRHMMDALRWKGTQSGHPEFASIEVDELKPDEIKWLDEKTNGTWRMNAELQANIQYQSMINNQIKTDTAQKAVYTYWFNNKTLDGLDPKILERARSNDAGIISSGGDVSTTFQSQLDRHTMLDAQNIILQMFQTSGTTYENISEALRANAERDPNFRAIATDYQTNMIATADRMNITLPQLVILQQTPPERQARLYQNFQFDVLKQNNQVVGEVIDLNNQIDFANQTGQDFYDIDQYRLHAMTDEQRSGWNPTDAQIYLAHQAGMSLQQYNDYLHELGKGNRGDFNNLPEYTELQLRQQFDADIEHFYAELAMSGHEGEYIYNPQTQTFELNPNSASYGAPMAMSMMTTRSFQIDPFIPASLAKSNQDFSDMAHGVNESQAAEADAYNLQLAMELGTYDAEHRRAVADYNAYHNLRGLDGGVYFNAEEEYQRRRAVYNPISENIYDYIDTTVITEPNKGVYDRPNKYNISNATLRDPKENIKYSEIDTWKNRGMTDTEINLARANITRQMIEDAVNKDGGRHDYNDIVLMVVGDWIYEYRRMTDTNIGLQYKIDTYNATAKVINEYDEDFEMPDGYNPLDGKVYYKGEVIEDYDDLYYRAEKERTTGIESEARDEERIINAEISAARGDEGVFDSPVRGSYDTNIDAAGTTGLGTTNPNNNTNSNEHDDYDNP